MERICRLVLLRVFNFLVLASGILNPGIEGGVRMTNVAPGATDGAASGTLEVFHQGAWGTVCAGATRLTEVHFPDHSAAYSLRLNGQLCKESVFDTRMLVCHAHAFIHALVIWIQLRSTRDPANPVTMNSHCVKLTLVDARFFPKLHSRLLNIRI